MRPGHTGRNFCTGYDLILEKITSRKNERLRAAAQLAASPRARQESGLFLAEGARLCADAAGSGLAVERAFFTAQALEKYAPYAERILRAAKEAYEVEEHAAALLSETKSPQGVFCVCRAPRLGLTPAGVKPDGRYLILERLQDPGNLGTILRTAEALGVDGVALAGACCDPFGPKALRAGMGAAFRLPLFLTESLAECAAAFRAAGIPVYAAVPAQDAEPVTACDFRGGAAIAVGNEGSGLTPEGAAACEKRVTIPMRGRAESLNAAASAAILLWELCRA